MSKVRISKAEAALWGIEHLAKFKKVQGRAVSSGKRKIKGAPRKAKALLAGKLTGDTKWKEEILRGRKSPKTCSSSPAQAGDTNLQSKGHSDYRSSNDDTISPET